MSSDLLAEFDSFYRAPQGVLQQPNSAANNLSFFDGATSSSQSWQARNVQPSAHHKKQDEDPWGDLSSFTSPTITQAGTSQEADPFAAFGISGKAAPPTTNVPKSNYQGGNIFKNETSQPMPGILRRSTLDLFKDNVMDLPEPSVAPNSYTRYPDHRPTLPPAKGSSGGDILFDADEMSEEDEDDDDDDFGEFESVSPPPTQAPKQALQPSSQSIDDFFGSMTIKAQPNKKPPNLLPTSPNLSAPLPYPQAPKSPSFQERNPFPKVALATKPITQVTKIKNQGKPKSASPITAWPNYDETPPKPALYVDSPDIPAIVEDIDDDWGDFSDLPAESPVTSVTKSASGIEAEAWAWDNADHVVTERTTPAINCPPPTNLPPPSILLALFPQLFDLPQSSLFKAASNQPFSLKNRIMSDPSTITFLRGYLLIATVAAHILAGRKSRWKRDIHLSQGMKIGPAGGKGGMKLTGIDKSEIAREEREAIECIRVWKEQLGRLRSAVAVANTSMKDSTKHLVIPEIAEAMQVKNQEGGLSAPKACIICGLKREERVVKVDVNVEDSFGEWWIEFWGHRLCRNWWQEHEGKFKM